MTWRRMDEEQPLDGQIVWYYFEVVGVHAGAYNKRFDQFFGVSGFLGGDVTHWMPIEEHEPAAPEGMPEKQKKSPRVLPFPLYKPKMDP